MRPDLTGLVVIFDLDGTLIDTAGDLADAMNHALALAGHAPVAAARVRHLVGHGARAMLAQGFAENGEPSLSASELDRHVGAFLDYYLANIARRSRPFPGAIEAIDALLGLGARAAICTNKREGPARLLIETLGLSDRFATIVGMDTTTAAKPDPAPVRLCLARTGATRGVFVGDSDTDLRAAANAGLPCLIADFGYGPLTLAAGAKARFGAYAELPALVIAAGGAAA
jgi:phosphoglycolate phosphatase